MAKFVLGLVLSVAVVIGTMAGFAFLFGRRVDAQEFAAFGAARGARLLTVCHSPAQSVALAKLRNRGLSWNQAAARVNLITGPRSCQVQAVHWVYLGMSYIQVLVAGAAYSVRAVRIPSALVGGRIVGEHYGYALVMVPGFHV